MAAQKRLYSEYPSFLGNTYAVEIWDTEWTDDPIEVTIGEGGARIHYAEAQERHEEFLPSDCSFTLQVIGDDEESFVDDLTSSPEGRFFIRVTKNGSLYWAGMVMTDVGKLPDEDRPRIEVRAVDGLGALKNLEYKNGVNAYYGDARFVEHLINALNKLSYVADMFPVGETLLKTSVDWWESTMGSSPSTTDPLYLAWVDHATFWDYDNSGQQKFLSCYEVIKQICTRFGARILQVEGSFWIEQISRRAAGEYYASKYDSTATLLGVDTATADNSLDQTNNGAKLATMDGDFFPPLLFVSCEQHKYNRRNYLAGYAVNQSTAQFNTYTQIQADGNNAALRLTGNLKTNVKNISYSGNTSNSLTAIFAAKIKVGSDACTRNFVVQNFQVVYSPAQWGADSIGSLVHLGSGIWPIPTGSNITHNETPIQFTTPPLSASGNLEFDLNLVAIYNSYDGSGAYLGDFEITWQLDNPRIEVFNGAMPDIDEDSVYYAAFGAETNTARYECETRIGDSTNPNTIGRIKVGPNASSLTSSIGWGAGTDPRTSDIGDLLCLTILKGQLSPTRRMYGTADGDFTLWRRYVDLAFRIWLFSGGTWVTASDSLEGGQWFGILYGDGGVSQTPIKKKYMPNPNIPPSAPTIPGTNGEGTNSELSRIPPGTVLDPLSTTKLATAQPIGAITSVPVTGTLAALDFYIGDKIALFNPVSGTYDTLDVTASSTTGATSIAVSGTLTVPYPQGSYIIKKPIIGHPSVFGHGPINKVSKWLFPNELTDSQIFDNGTGVTIGNTTVDVLFNVNGSAGMSINGGTNASYGSGLKFRNDSFAHISIGMKGAAWMVANTSSGAGVWAGTPGDLLQIASGGGVTIFGLAGTGTRMVTASSAGLLSVQAIPTGLTDGDKGDITVSASGATWTIDNDVVTYAKMQNVTSSRIMGRVTAGAGDMEELTTSQVQTLLGFLDGSLTATRVPFALDANTLTDDATLTWDNTNKRLVIGTGTAQALINLFYGAVSGTQQTLRSSGNVNGNMVMSHLNASNASTSANCLFQISVGGASAGDPVIQFSVSGVSDFAIGPDNSATGDPFRMTPGASLPGGIVDHGLTVTNETTPKIGVNKDLPAYPLDVTGITRAGGYCNSTGSITVLYANGAGTGPSTTQLSGGSNAFLFSFTTGTSPTANGTVFTITLPSFFPTNVVPAWSPDNDQTATDLLKFRKQGSSQNSFTIKAVGTLAASTAYAFNFVIGAY